ncbi:kelch repeat-containing protein [Daejeonella sp.]|uniref:Kelch repeat-containing protein n=1 Tax=Daejeonella sp. TaxID=2805397 RepID=UPI0030C2704B
MFITILSSCKKPNLVPNPVPKELPPITVNSDCKGGNGFFCISNIEFKTVDYNISDKRGWAYAYGAVAVSSGKIFFAGGHDEGNSLHNSTMDEVKIYTPLTGSQDLFDLSVARSHLSGISVGNTVLFAGGNSSRGAYPLYSDNTSLEYFEDVDIFSSTTPITYQKAKLSQPRAYMAAVSCNNKAWFIGGRNASNAGIQLNSTIQYSDRIDIFDPSANVWSQLTLPRPRAYAGAVAVGNKIYIGGGKNDTGNLTIVDVYDVSSQRWTTLTAPNEHPYASVCLLNDQIFIAGGDGKLNKSVDIYDTQSGTWRYANLSDSRFDMAVSVANNKIVYLGGNYSGAIDVYNDVTHIWSRSTIVVLSRFTDALITGMASATLNNRFYISGYLSNQGNAQILGMTTIDL